MPTVSGVCRIASRIAPFRRGIPTLLLLLQESVLLAQGTGTSPWVMAVDELSDTFTGPLAKGLSLIAIVVGGLMFAYGEGGSKRALAGTIFGLGMALGAANFMQWLFGV
ncbi:MAG: TrbC/VirB2 family protein [Acidobacteriota bacterium]|nr:TrbC/VirB2 family protein [Acidobacteriota bacterium]MDE2965733.1 TrbC/VirB2 family protein [Acidobacteriota bacterium]